MDVPANGRQRIVIITGMSGSGKSTAIRALEDAGFFCIDNLPVVLLPKLTDLAELAAAGHRALALVVDAREGHLPQEGAAASSGEVRRAGHQVEVLFLDASDESLIRRFSETRRRHPLAPDGSVRRGHRPGARGCWRDLRELADQVIDTSALNVHDLKRLVHGPLRPEPAAAAPEPHRHVLWLPLRRAAAGGPGLRRALPAQPVLRAGAQGAHRARTRRVAATCWSAPETQEFLDKVVDLCRFLFPRYQKEGKAYLTVALGCTGGKHRSVAVARGPGAAPRRRTRPRPALGPGHREGVGPRPGRPSEQALLQACYWRREALPRVVPTQGSRWTPAGSPPISVLLSRWHVNNPVGRTCRMVAAHGGVGVGAAGGLQRGVIMVGLVVAAHGRLAQELVATAEQIMGALPEVATVSIEPGTSPETIRAQMRAAVKEHDHGEGVLVLADLFGGTPCKESLLLCGKANVEVLAGVNLPMLMKAASLRKEQLPLHELAQSLYTYAQRNIRFASELVRDASGRHVTS